MSEAGWLQIGFMSEAGWLQIIGFIVTLGTLWLTMHYKLKGVESKADAIKTEVSEVGVKTTHIEKLANSTLSDVKTELVTANGHIKALQEVVKALADRNGRVDVATRIVKVEETVKVEPTKEP